MTALDGTLGAVELGVLVSTVLYGIACLQCFLYAEADFKDPLWLRIMVGLVWAFETLHTAFTWVMLYSMTVTHYGKPNIINDATWYMAVLLPITSILGSSVQIFFAHRVRLLSGGLLIPIIAWSGAVLRCAFGITLAIVLVMSKQLTVFSAHYRWLITTQFSLSAAVDVLTTLAMCIHLLRRRSGLKLTQRLVNKLLLYTIETGVVTSLCAAALLVAALLMPHNFVNWGLFMVYPKLFSNSFFALLNARRSLRAMNPGGTDVWSLSILTQQPSDIENRPISLDTLHRQSSRIKGSAEIIPRLSSSSEEGSAE